MGLKSPPEAGHPCRQPSDRLRTASNYNSARAVFRVEEKPLTRDRPGNGSLEPSEVKRYARHLVLPEVGAEGQERLRAASVLIVGAGGLGSPLALYLAAAGVGHLGIVDFDSVDESNLQRQVLYGTADVGRSKVEVATERVGQINPHVEVVPYETRLAPGNAFEIMRPYDVIVDGTDNFGTRYLVNDACVMLGKPNVHGSVFRFEGQLSVFWSGKGPCYRCLFPNPPEPGSVPNCAEGGVLGVLPGIIGTMQATETIKLILGRGSALIGRLLLFDALEARFHELRLSRDTDCPVCGDRPTLRELSEAPVACAPVPGDTTRRDLGVKELQARLARNPPPVLLDVRTQAEWMICRLEGAVLIPVQELEHRLAELDAAAETVVYCHTGVRSAVATEMLRHAGFDDVTNLSGGIDAWARRIDESMARY
jgi:molybdopterin/thiamine biosynthesis adenylyltransferase/rhodanese-related sulfurtransferase